MDLIFKFTEEEATYIINILAHQPYKEVEKTIAKIQIQAKEQFESEKIESAKT